MEAAKRPVIIYAENTPNPAAMKFVANIMLVGNEAVMQYSDKIEASKTSPLAENLFSFPFVTAILIAGNFVTLTKNNSVQWDDVILEIREFLKKYLSEGHPIVTKFPDLAANEKNIQGSITAQHAAPVSETEQKIINILEEYIRPAVEQDGGLITFKSFHEGTVTLELQGSCKGCPSAALTLKAGIEGLLKKMVPEVQEVVSDAMM